MCGELSRKRRDQVAPVLFVDVPEIEVKIRDRGLTGITQGFHIFDDCRTGKDQRLNYLEKKNSEGTANQSMLLPEPATNKMSLSGVWRRNGTGAYDFHESRGASRNPSIPYMSCLQKTRLTFLCDGGYTRHCDS